MNALKRKHRDTSLQRRVRPRKEVDSDIGEPGLDHSSGSSDESPQGDHMASENGDDDGEDESEASSEVPSHDCGPTIDTSQVTFGALARAQATLPPARKAKAVSGRKDGEKPAQALEPKGPPKFKSASEREMEREKLRRADKHAPQEMTSKRQVSRRRDIVEVPRIQARDPRFGPLGRAPMDETKARKAYAFLDKYRDDEMKQLKAAIKKTKDPAAKEQLQKALMSMESKKKAQERKDREKAVIEEHRKQEKELVKQGKKPFYLKKSEQKKRLLLDQYASMNKGRVDKVIEKKRKKLAAKEKKELPLVRRSAES